MLFNEPAFALFLPLVLLLYYASSTERRRWLLLGASYFFYGWWDWRFCGLVILSTVVDYACGLSIAAATNVRRRKTFLGLSIAVNLSLLSTFKYFNFFADSACGLLQNIGFEPHIPTLEIILPVGISFYTFQTLSYTIDVYRGSPPERGFLNFANFVVFFPQLVAGPIMRAGDLIPQLRSNPEAKTGDLSAGTLLIIKGLIKKAVIADNLATLVDNVYGNPNGFGSAACWFATYAYAFQIYMDFSGYTDIAIGTAKLFGVHLMKNFDHPYMAIGPSDFWRRWHISLSTWIRDYVFIPLGGSRHGLARTALALTVTMALGGLWHGAAWTFVVWGLFHGLLLAGERVLRLIPPKRHRLPFPVRAIRVLVMFHLACIGWVLFRAPDIDTAWTILVKLVVWEQGTVIGRRIVAITVLCALLHLIGDVWPRLQRYHPGPIVQGAMAAAAAYAIILLAPESVPFVYFQF